MITKRESEERTIKRCLPCRKCGLKPRWGGGYLVCPRGHYETDEDVPMGRAAREWNREMRGGGR